MPKTGKAKRRSECPLNASVEMLGDRWSLLIVRDMMLRDARTYKEFLECYEGIATNVSADRLRRLIAYGIIATEPDPTDGRKTIYLLTAKGIDLAPVLTEMVLGRGARRDRQSASHPANAGRQEEVSSASAATLGQPPFATKLNLPGQLLSRWLGAREKLSTLSAIWRARGTNLESRPMRRSCAFSANADPAHTKVTFPLDYLFILPMGLW